MDKRWSAVPTRRRKFLGKIQPRTSPIPLLPIGSPGFRGYFNALLLCWMIWSVSLWRDSISPDHEAPLLFLPPRASAYLYDVEGRAHRKRAEAFETFRPTVSPILFPLAVLQHCFGERLQKQPRASAVYVCAWFQGLQSITSFDADKAGYRPVSQFPVDSFSCRALLTGSTI